MSLTTCDIALHTLDTLKGVDALCLFVGEDERPLSGASGLVDWRLCGRLSRVLLDGFFQGARGEKLLLPGEGRLPIPRIFVFGIGPLARFDEEALSSGMTEAGRMLTRAQVKSVALEVPGAGRLPDAARAAALLQPFGAAFRGQDVAIFSDRNLGRHLPTSVRAKS